MPDKKNPKVHTHITHLEVNHNYFEGYSLKVNGEQVTKHQVAKQLENSVVNIINRHHGEVDVQFETPGDNSMELLGLSGKYHTTVEHLVQAFRFFAASSLSTVMTVLDRHCSRAK